MKLSFKCLLVSLAIITLNTHAGAVLMSGAVPTQDKELIHKIIENILGNDRLTQWDVDNKECERRPGFLLQLCWKGTDFHVIYQKRRALSKSVGRLIEINKQEKALSKKALL